MKIPSRSQHTFNLWHHIPSKRVYAIRLTDGRVTGCVGPMAFKDCHRVDVRHLSYDKHPELAAWADQHQDEFDLGG
jgi:hypothetical protein